METSTDILIVGAGASGLSAALAAQAEGASVKVIDKCMKLGGTAAISGGVVWMPNNHVMRAEGHEDSAKAGKEYFMSLDHGDLREPILDVLLREGPEVLSKLDEMNALSLSLLNGYPDYYLDRPGAKPEGGRALDNELFSFKDLGEWADKVYTCLLYTSPSPRDS